MIRHLILSATAILSMWSCAQAQPSTLPQAGVNLAGAEFASGTFWPTPAEIDYFVTAKGMRMIRIPFLWERMQPSLNGTLNITQLTNLQTLVNYATSVGATVVLDPHNYARYNGNLIGSTAVPNAAFANLWDRLARAFSSNPRVVFGLMNEPNTMPTEQWRDAANAGIAAIRATGASNLILVPGNAWTGAHSWSQNWYGTSNAQVMLSITDPSNNFAFELHQYFDSDYSGTTASCTAGNGAAQLSGVTAWLRSNNRKGYLGEFAGGNNTACRNAIESALNHLSTNSDVWMGWSWWAAGPQWGNYIFTLEPTNNYTQDAAQMTWLMPFIPPPTSNVDIFKNGFE
jgi:endoglucanase